MSYTSRTITMLALAAACFASAGCSGGGSSSAPIGDGDSAFIGQSRVDVEVVPPGRLLLERGETARVRLYTELPTALGIDFSERETGIAIDAGPCVPAEELCEEWQITAGFDAVRGNHAIPVLVAAEGDADADNANTVVALTVFPPERTPPIRRLDAGRGAAFAIDDSGATWSWGADEGQLGDKLHRPVTWWLRGVFDDANLPFRSEALPRRVVGLPPDVLEIAVGINHGQALDASGTVWAWGRGDYGRLGNGRNTVSIERPAAIAGMHDIVSTATGVWGGAAVGSDGSLWVWGHSTSPPTSVSGLPPLAEVRNDGFRDQMVARDYNNGVWQWDAALEPDAVPLLDASALPRISAVRRGNDHYLALDENGTVWAWGKNDVGQLGDGTFVDRESPVRVALPAGVVITSIAAGTVHSLALDTEGDVWAWGGNPHGQLGDGTYVDQAVPTRVQLSGLRATALAAAYSTSYAIVAECGGAVRAWGDNSTGQLGIGVWHQRSDYNVVSSAVPAPVAGLGEAGDCGGTRRLMVYLVDGAASVSSDRGTLQCPPDLGFCWDILPVGSTVMLTAESTDGRQPAWHWDCGGTGPSATVVMDDHTYCKVGAQQGARLPLTVTLWGGGEGRVQSTPPGIDCPDVCTAEFDTTVSPLVVLRATPDNHTWDPDDCPDGRVLLTHASSCDVHFERGTSRLLVSRAGAGTGTVESTPAGIDCGLDCSEEFAASLRVTLTAVADAGSSFSHWEGDPECPADTSASGTVTLDEETHCTAVFNRTTAPTTAALSVAIDEIVGSAAVRTGTVVSAPAGIQCGNGESDCSESYPLGTVVTLSATPAPSSRLRGWNGHPDCEDGSVTMDASKACSAVFDSELSTGRASLTFAIVGNGTVATTDGRIGCPGDCTEIYDFNEAVVVDATPAAGEQFLGWDGACASAGTQSQFSMALTSDVSCTARFGQPPAGTALTVSLVGSGAIHVYEGASLLLQCPAGGTPCTIARPAGSLLHVLWAAPGPGLDFLGWGGDCANQQTRTSFNLTLDRAYVCTATAE